MLNFLERLLPKKAINKYGWDKCPDQNLVRYMDACHKASIDDRAFNNFRRNPDYQKILEGGEQVVGEMALKNIRALGGYDLLMQKIAAFKENDMYGNPIVRSYDGIGSISPSTLRYVATVLDIRKLLGSIIPKKIVEVGGGYGGLCKVISSVYNFDEYTLVDLPPVIDLCKKYIAKFDNLKNRVKFIKSTEDFQPSTYDLFISDSAFAECGLEFQNKYINNFIMGSKYTYITFNTLHVKETQSEIQNLKKAMNGRNLKEYPFDDKLVVTIQQQ